MQLAPISVLSFNRPHLLRAVLESLRQQTVPVGPVSLFQDGGSDQAETCLTIFREIFPDGQAFPATENLGVALNFDRAERHTFEQLKADCGIFLEDDLVLGPHYLDALSQLTEFALNERRVAYVAAYGIHTASAEEQRARSSEIVPMEHKWGFALTRRQWEAQREIVEPYLEIIRRAPYAKRDNRAILSYFDKLGYSSTGTSQDGAKDVAMVALGTMKLMSFACFAKYEGRDGQHYNAKLYDERGYGRTAIYPEPPRLNMPSSTKLDEWIGSRRSHARSMVSTALTSDIKQKIFGSTDPFQGFTPSLQAPDLQGWNGNHPTLIRLVEEKRPKVIVDLGVWKGQSTVTLATAQRRVVNGGTVIAVDTFLGSPEHWNPERKDVQEALRFKNGRPEIYETFLSNIALCGFADYVVPLAQTSENAATILKRNRISVDLVHIDAAHEYEPVLRDIGIWWEMPGPGGILVGDDFVWPGVARAVVHFSDQVGLPFGVESPKWWIKKP